MKKVQANWGTFVFVCALALLLVPAVFAEEPAEVMEPAMEQAVEPAMEPALSIDRMVICENIVDREPIGASDTFSASVEKVYCFIEAKNIKEDTTVYAVWYFHGNEMAKVPLKLRQGDRWRTYSSKNLNGMKGDWKVEIHDPNEVILKIAEFKVE